MPDYRKTSEGLLREVINTQGELPFEANASNMIFGQPSELLDDPRGDTRIKVRGVQNSEFRNQSVEIFYDRLDLGVLFGGSYRPEVEAIGQSTLWRLLPDINKALGTQFTKRDLEDIDISTLGESSEVTLELRAKPGSPAFKGFTRITFFRRKILLTDVITVTEYEQLKHPDPLLEGFTSAGLLTWGIDFTLIADYLRVNNSAARWRGDFTDLSGLRTALKDNYGIENWPGNDTTVDGSGTVDVYDTRDVPEANTDFQRVVVQTEIRENGYVGTAYFHYNTL